jgi:hypothetical protein
MKDEDILKPPEEPKNIFDPIDFMIFKEEIQDDFQTICSKTAPDTREKRALILSKYLTPKFSFIFQFQDLVKLGFSKKIYYLENCPQNIDEFQLVFLIPSKIECIELAIKQFKKDNEDITNKQKNFNENKFNIIQKNYYFYFVPKIDISVLSYIEENYSLYRTYFDNYFEFELLNFPLDFDLISLEDSQSFKELYLYKFSDCIDNLANLLIKIQEIFGKIKYKYIVGENGQILSNLLNKKEKEGFLSEKNNNEILACFFFDRSADYITPMCTEYTYEAMLHSNFGISFDKVKVKSDIISSEEDKKNNKIINNNNIINENEEKKGEYKIINVGMEDKLYYMIKNYNFDKIRLFLSKRLLKQQEQLRQGETKKKNFDSVEKDLELIKLIKEERPSLSNHINIADYLSKKMATPRAKRRLQLEQTLMNGDKNCLDIIHEYYDTEMARKGDEYDLLKLFCLENLIFGGVKNKIYDIFKNDFLLTYDERFFFLFKNLEELKILKRGGSSKLYQILLDKLKILNIDVNIYQPNDTSYVFSGFSPISIKLIEKAMNPGWGAIYKDVLKNYGCEFIFPENEKPITDPQTENNVILLVFIGGITYSEIAAIRYLNNSEKYQKRKFLILTTHVISGKSFFDSIRTDDIELAVDMSGKIQKPKEREETISEKKLKKLKDEEEKEKKKKEKEEKEKIKKEEDRKKEIEKDRAEFREKKKKEEEKKKEIEKDKDELK